MARGRDDDLDVMTAIQQGRLDPVYVLTGAERFLVDRCVDALRASVLGAGASPGLNLEVFEAREQGLAPALTAARTLPMFSRRRMVVVRGLDQLKAEELEPLLAYVADPNPSTCLAVTAEKLDGRWKAVQQLKKAGLVHDFPRLRDREIPAWILREAKLRGLTITSDGAGALAEAVGAELAQLAMSLEQLSLFAGAGQRIERSHVESLIAETRERSVFELTRSIGEGQTEQALRLLANMLQNREPPLRIQFMLMRQLRQIWRAKELLAAGAPRPEIASAVGIAPFFLDDVLTPARRMSTAALEGSFRRLCESDRLLKSSRVDGELIITRAVHAMTEAAGNRR